MEEESISSGTGTRMKVTLGMVILMSEMELITAGLFHGQGTFKRRDGDTYIGGFKNDVFHGHGTYNYRDGDKYEGTYVQGERHGIGVYYYKNGNVYEGTFVK